MKKIYHANSNHWKAGLTRLIADKIVFKTTTKNVTTDKEGHFIMIKWSIHQEDVTITNICGEQSTKKYMKQN